MWVGVVGVRIRSSEGTALMDRGWCPGLGGGDHAWAPTVPAPSCPRTCGSRAVVTFLSLQSGPGQSEAGRAHPLASGSGRQSGVEKREVL